MACLLYSLRIDQDPSPGPQSLRLGHKDEKLLSLLPHEGNDICPALCQNRMAETTPGHKCPSISLSQSGNSMQITLLGSRPIDSQTMHYVNCLQEGIHSHLHNRAPWHLAQMPALCPSSFCVLPPVLPFAFPMGHQPSLPLPATSALLQQKLHPM